VKPVGIASLCVVVAAVVDRAGDLVRRPWAPRRRLLVVAFAVVVFAPAAFLAVADAAGSRVAGFRWFAAAPAPASWGHRALPPGAGILSFPATFVDGHDRDGIARERLDRHGTVLVYLDLTPMQGPERLRDWPSYRLGLVRGESNDVHENRESPLIVRARSSAGNIVLSLDAYGRRLGRCALARRCSPPRRLHQCTTDDSFPPRS
jgi:hypothetical protein